MRGDLAQLYAEYLKRESVYVKAEGTRIKDALREPEQELGDIERKLAQARTALAESGEHDPKQEELMSLEEKISTTRVEKDELSRGLGRVEGMIEFEEKRLSKLRGQNKEIEMVAYRDVHGFTQDMESYIDEATQKETIEDMRTVFARAREALKDFLARIHSSNQDKSNINPSIGHDGLHAKEIVHSTITVIGPSDER